MTEQISSYATKAAVQPTKKRNSESVDHGWQAGPHAALMTLQRSAGNRAVSQVLQIAADQQSATTDHTALPDGGQSLDPVARSFMESRFGHDFSGVRVHTDSRAAESAEAVAAQAYTVGQDVVFGQGHYAPATPEGKQLLAHELAHVVQQSRGGSSVPSLSPNSPLEQAADQAASTFTQGSGVVQVSGTSAPGLARQAKKKSPWETFTHYVEAARGAKDSAKKTFLSDENKDKGYVERAFLGVDAGRKVVEEKLSPEEKKPLEPALQVANLVLGPSSPPAQKSATKSLPSVKQEKKSQPTGEEGVAQLTQQIMNTPLPESPQSILLEKKIPTFLPISPAMQRVSSSLVSPKRIADLSQAIERSPEEVKNHYGLTDNELSLLKLNLDNSKRNQNYFLPEPPNLESAIQVALGLKQTDEIPPDKFDEVKRDFTSLAYSDFLKKYPQGFYFYRSVLDYYHQSTPLTEEESANAAQEDRLAWTPYGTIVKESEYGNYVLGKQIESVRPRSGIGAVAGAATRVFTDDPDIIGVVEATGDLTEAGLSFTPQRGTYKDMAAAPAPRPSISPSPSLVAQAPNTARPTFSLEGGGSGVLRQPPVSGTGSATINQPNLTSNRQLLLPGVKDVAGSVSATGMAPKSELPTGLSSSIDHLVPVVEGSPTMQPRQLEFFNLKRPPSGSKIKWNKFLRDLYAFKPPQGGGIVKIGEQLVTFDEQGNPIQVMTNRSMEGTRVEYFAKNYPQRIKGFDFGHLGGRSEFGTNDWLSQFHGGFPMEAAFNRTGGWAIAEGKSGVAAHQLFEQGLPFLKVAQARGFVNGVPSEVRIYVESARNMVYDSDWMKAPLPPGIEAK